MTDLIERIENAAEGSRELDGEIRATIEGGDNSGSMYLHYNMIYKVAHHTTSIDAKLPNENIIKVEYDFGACMWTAYQYIDPQISQIGYGNTEALARRAAALKARSA